MRHHRVVVCLALLVFSANLLAQADVPPIRWLDSDTTEPAGTQYATFQSELVGGEVSYLIYLPDGYETNPERRYPVVYWLHGMKGNQRTGQSFVRQLAIASQRGHAPPMIAVLVNGMYDSWYCDSPDGKWPVESVIVKELVPHIDATYRTIARRDRRGVEGYSMGGFGAARLAFKFPDVFGAVGIMAGGLLDTDRLLDRHHTIRDKMFGGDQAEFAKNHPSVFLEKNASKIRDGMRVRIAVGGEDRLQIRSQYFHELLTRTKVKHDYEVVPGIGHNSRVFYETLGPRAFHFYRDAFARPRRQSQRAYPGQSQVIKTGDVEILTFDTAEDFHRLQELFEETRSAALEPGEPKTLYFRSNMDGSVQPYSVRLPLTYDSSRSWPVVVQLHGLNFNKVLGGGQRIKYKGMRRRDGWYNPDVGAIVVQCFGRQSTFYAGMGEVDILEVIYDVQRRFATDPERVYVMGHSMGGAGSFTLGLHFPDLFGGITPIDAALGSRLSISAELPDWMKPQAALYRPENLAANARNVPVFMKHAGAGIQGDSMFFTDAVTAEGGFSTTESFPGMPHGFAQRYSYANFVSQLIEHPIQRDPPEVKLFTTTLRFNSAYWVTIDRLTRHNAPSRVHASLSGDALVVKTENIDALTLRPPNPGAATSLTVDRNRIHSGELPAEVHVSKVSGKWEMVDSQPLAGKRHGLQGPVSDALRSKFLGVYGEGDRDLAIAELDGIRNPPNPLIISGDFPMKAAADLTEDDVRNTNLILFGTRESNPVIRRLAAGLPAELLDADTNGARAIFIHPNPENRARYVVVWPSRLMSNPENGLRAGWVLPVCLLPDYAWVKDGKVTAGGHFDNHWKIP